MLHARRTGWRALPLALLVAGLIGLTPTAAPAAPRHNPAALQSAFRAAATEFAVPESLLLAVSYNLSRWETHRGAPSVAGGYGPMHLLDPAAARPRDSRGLDAPRPRPLRPAQGANSLEEAAGLLGVRPALLRTDPAQNIRGGGALLARIARDLGIKPARLADWYGTVARFSGAADEAPALDFAEQVFATIRGGAARTTGDGQQVSLAAQPVTPNRDTARGLGLRPSPATAPECPPELGCLFIPAAYQPNTADDPADYGNYDFADRTLSGPAIRYIIIHNTEIDYNLTLRVFQTPTTYVSTHYVVRSSDGQVAQMVKNKNVGWHAGNWYFNGHSIGIEHEGVAIEGATWYTEPMYRASARLVRYLAARYQIPIDRTHIIGHDEIPGPTPQLQAGMHWDPGPFWDWAHYMELLGAPLRAAPDSGGPGIITIAPDFASNRPGLTYCYGEQGGDCREVERQGTNFVYLRTAPDPNAPYVSNEYLGSDPTRAYNWGNKAVAGQRFYRAERRGDWDGIYYGGQLAWLYNPGFAATAPARGLLITPRPGVESIPVYGRAYPEEAAYPEGVAPQSITPIYTMPAGQIYVASNLVGSAYYWAPAYAVTPEAASHRTIAGETLYYQITFNHRFGFVKASDVQVITDRPVR